MSLGEKTQKRGKIYLTISKGAVERKKNGQIETYEYVEGELVKIYTQPRTFAKEEVKFWYVDLQDEENIYSVCLPYSSGVMKSIVLSLANCRDYSKIKIKPYEKDGFTKVQVFSSGSRLDWITKELPSVEVVTVGNKTVKDDSKRMGYIEDLVKAINTSIGAK